MQINFNLYITLSHPIVFLVLQNSFKCIETTHPSQIKYIGMKAAYVPHIRKLMCPYLLSIKLHFSTLVSIIYGPCSIVVRQCLCNIKVIKNVN